MYDKLFGFSGRPFQLTPDHFFFFESRVHRKAMAYLTYGLSRSEGFIVITGDVGAGKTTLINHLTSSMDDEHFAAGKVVTTQLESHDLLRMVAAAFRVDAAGADKATVLQRIEASFLASCRCNIRPVLIVDEAQNLGRNALEELRMLSNLQLQETPLVQIYLVGQPEFRQTLSRPDLEQLRQRVIAAYHLQPMDLPDTRRYVEHRLRQVDWRGDPSISENAFRAIYEASGGGLPRKINLLADRLLTFCCLENKHAIDEAAVLEVAHDMWNEGLHTTNLETLPDTRMRSRPIAAKDKGTRLQSETGDSVGGFGSENTSGQIEHRLDELEERIRLLDLQQALEQRWKRGR